MILMRVYVTHENVTHPAGNIPHLSSATVFEGKKKFPPVRNGNRNFQQKKDGKFDGVFTACVSECVDFIYGDVGGSSS